MPTEVINLLIQVPLIGVFIYFALRMSQDYRIDTAKRDAQWQAFMDERNKLWMESRAQQDELWRAFIREINDRNGNFEDMIGQRLAELASLHKSLIDDFKAHDQRTFSHAGKQ
jgi:hypothetical protein